MALKHDERLRWQCRRGMRELDILLTRYLDARYPLASAAEQAQFSELLQQPDPVLYQWFTNPEAGCDPEFSALVSVIRQQS